MATKRAVRFTNFSEEDFVGVWDKEEFLIPAGESTMLQEYLALHFAKHLIDRELNKENKPTNLIQHRNPMMEKCVGRVFVEAGSQLKLEQKMLNNEIEAKTEKVKEEEFAGLKEEGEIARKKPENDSELAKDTDDNKHTSTPENVVKAKSGSKKSVVGNK